jgi:hypothetical protein
MPVTPFYSHPMNNPTGGFRIRPRFEHTVPFSLQTFRDAIRAAVAPQTGEFEVNAKLGLVVIHIAQEQCHRWSPRLQLSLEEAGPEQTHVVGVYGPEHEVWALFLYGYIITGLLAMFSGIYGFAQMFLGDSPWALWVTGSMLVIGLALYLLAQLGQKLGSWQTFQLHKAYLNALDSLREDTSESGASI